MTIDLNKETYRDKEIVKYWSKQVELQPAELAVYNLFKEKLKDLILLDIGIGAGRTTFHFAPFCKEYYGIDYSDEMINYCKKRFSHFPVNLKFDIADVRNLRQFEESKFDIVLFSFNGIDYILNEERIKAFKEIFRITKNGGYFCFSTHNIRSIDMFYKFKFSFNYKQLIKELIRFYKIHNKNDSQAKLLQKDNSFFYDGALNFKLNTYYIKPEKQIEQINNIGFKNVKIFSSNGLEIINIENLMTNKDVWLYYLCEK